MTKKKIISLILALAICIGSVMSLSSCMLFDLLFYTDIEKEESDTPNDPASQSPANPSVSDELEFYPSAGGEEVTPENIAQMSRALLSCVSIKASFEIRYGYPSNTTETTTSRGSGVIYKINRERGDAYIITNYHVVYQPDAITANGISTKIRVFLYGQELESYAITATYVGGSMANDIAVLRVSSSDVIKNSQALAATPADSDAVAVFDTVYAIGNPEGYGISATNGIISVESEPLNMTGADGKTAICPRVMRVSAAINDGNSGGGLFNSAGQLIGIVNAKRNGTSIDNIAYAIPSNVAIGLADNIILYCDGSKSINAKKAMLGVTLEAKIAGVIIDEDGKVKKGEIVEIKEISDTCAIKSSIAVGDRINSITVGSVAKTVTRIHHVVDAMLLARVGDTVIINVTRGTETFNISVIVYDEMFVDV